jgi:hypothetical protein
MARSLFSYIPNTKLNKQFKAELNDIANIIGATISSQILKKAQSNIYSFQVPSKYKYVRKHTLAKNIGFTVKGGVVTIFSNVKYAHYLESLVGARWNTHYSDADLNVSINSLTEPSGNRPYGNFVPGVIAGMKIIKNKKLGGINWKV